MFLFNVDQGIGLKVHIPNIIRFKLKLLNKSQFYLNVSQVSYSLIDQLTVRVDIPNGTHLPESYGRYSFMMRRVRKRVKLAHFIVLFFVCVWTFCSATYTFLSNCFRWIMIFICYCCFSITFGMLVVCLTVPWQCLSESSFAYYFFLQPSRNFLLFLNISDVFL